MLSARLVPLVALAVLLAGLPIDAHARVPGVSMQFSTPGQVAAGALATYEGQMTLGDRSVSAPAPIPQQDVTILEGTHVLAHTTTGATGKFHASIALTARGRHDLYARVDALDAESDVATVLVVVPPRIDSLTGIQSTRWNVSHLDWTVDDGGYPPYGFRILRSTNGGPWASAATVSGFARSFEEAVAPGAHVTYRMDASNFAGPSNVVTVTDDAPTAPADALAASLTLSWGCLCSPTGGWKWGYTSQADVQSSHAFAGVPTLTGQVTSLGAGAARRVVSADVTGWITDYCYPDRPCTGNSINVKHVSGLGVVAPDGSFSVTLPELNWTWGGLSGATSSNHFSATVTIDTLSATDQRTIALETDPCVAPHAPCGGGA